LTYYALLLDQSGFDAGTTLPIVERALETDFDHAYTQYCEGRNIEQVT